MSILFKKFNHIKSAYTKEIFIFINVKQNKIGKLFFNVLK